MRQARVLIVIALVGIHGLLSSQGAIGLKCGYVHDKSFNKVGSNLVFMNIPVVDNRYSLLTQFIYESGLEDRISKLFSLRLTSRKVNYSYYGTVVTDFWHFTLEVPMGIRFKHRLSNALLMQLDLEAGGNYVLTPDHNTSVADVDNNHFQFVRTRKLCYFGQTGLNIVSRLNNHQSLSLFIAYQLQLTPLFRYRMFNANFDVYGNEMYTSNINFGVIFSGDLGQNKNGNQH
jgi:hypothetical protein